MGVRRRMRLPVLVAVFLICVGSLAPIASAEASAPGFSSPQGAALQDASGALRLSGHFSVSELVTSSVNNPDPVGLSANVHVTFSPTCTSGACATTMTRVHRDGVTTTTYSISPTSDGGYSGKSSYLASCLTSGGTIEGAYTYAESMMLTTSGVDDGVATAFQGTVTIDGTPTVLGASNGCTLPTSETIQMTGNLNCAPSAPVSVGAVSGYNFARIHWSAGPSNGCPVSGFSVSDGLASWTVGPSFVQKDIFQLTTNDKYIFTVAALSNTASSSATPANSVTPGKPNYCPGNDRKLSVAKTDDNVEGNTFWRIEDDVVWCTRYGVATFNTDNPTGYTAWTDKIGFSWLAGPTADLLTQFLGINIGHPCTGAVKPSLEGWPTSAGQNVALTTYPCFEVSEHFLTLALTLATLGEGSAEKSVGEEIIENGLEWLEENKAEVDHAIGTEFMKLVEQYGVLNSPKLKAVFGKTLASAITNVVQKIVNVEVTIIVNTALAGITTVAKLYAWLDKQTTLQFQMPGSMTVTISPHGQASTATTMPFYWPFGTLETYTKTTTPA